ncbi:MAG TPA: hypothetical protein VE130_17405 [Nitrososphaeraceae archaeon]|nr:hypothetical protein [Nitrososphaeraceae archaeon]
MLDSTHIGSFNRSASITPKNYETKIKVHRLFGRYFIALPSDFGDITEHNWYIVELQQDGSILLRLFIKETI